MRRRTTPVPIRTKRRLWPRWTSHELRAAVTDTFTLSGDSLTLDDHIDSATPQWKVTPYADYAVKTGNTFTVHLARAQ